MLSETQNLPTSLDRRVKRAWECFKRGQSYFGDTWSRAKDDQRFDAADSDNNFQWPLQVLQYRQLRKKPLITINMTQVHNNNIINDIQQNRPGMAFKATSGGAASLEAAKVVAAIGRRVEYQSCAAAAYDKAVDDQVRMGTGYWRIITKYVDEDSFDQDIYVAPIMDPFMVVRDPDTLEPNKSDMKWCIIFKDTPKDEFQSRYGEEMANKYNNTSTLDSMGWVTEDHIREAEFYYTIERKDELFEILDERSGQPMLVHGSDLSGDMKRTLRADKRVRRRKVMAREIKWVKIVGTEVLEETDWPGKYIPVVPLCGMESFIDGHYDAKGHTRNMKDPQRIYNYMSSTSVEFSGVQSRVPYIGAAEAIEGYESYWNTANEENYSILPYRGVGDDGKPLPAPQRQQPPVASEAYIKGMEIARSELMNVSGQQESQLGAQGNERTGAAKRASINAGDRSTAHFKTQLGHAITYSAMIVLDLVPKIYDTQRTIDVIAEDGTTFQVQIDPDAKQALAQRQARNQEAAQLVFNPKLGKYWVAADTGPGYSTRVDQMIDALTLIITQNPNMGMVVGDMLVRAMNFDGAAEAADRLKRMIPPQALGKGPSPKEQELAQQLQQTGSLLEATMEDLAKAQLALKGKESKRDIDAYKAETERLKAFFDAMAKGVQMANQRVKDGQDANLAWSQLLADMAANPLAEDTLRPTKPTEQPVPMPGEEPVQ